MSITIPPYGSHDISLLFKPTAEGLRTGSLSFTSNIESSPHTVPLIGTGKVTGPVDPGPDPTGLTYLSADGGKLRNLRGLGSVERLRSINWYGFEQTGVPGGVWTRPIRTKTIGSVLYEGMLDEIKRLGFNSIRLQISQDCTWAGYKPQTRHGYWNSVYINTEYNPEFLNSTIGENPQDVKTTIEILDIFIGWCEELGLRVIFDQHTLAPDDSNVLATNGKWYTTTTPSDIGATAGIRREPRSELQAISALVFLANRYKGRPVVCGFDVINEPHVCTWDRDPLTGILGFYERAGNAIHAVNPDVLIICEGITGNIDHTPVGHETDSESLAGKYEWGTWWSGKLDEAGSALVNLTIPNKVVYSPHEYGAYLEGVPLQPWFDPAAEVGAGYAGEAFPTNMPAVWSRSWGYLAEQDIAPVWIGEFGSYLRVGGDPITGNGSGYTETSLALDEQWLDTMAAYCDTHDIGFAYWAWNPGGDPDGLVGQAPVGTWQEAQDFKLSYLSGYISPVAVGELALFPAAYAFGMTETDSYSYKAIEVRNSTSNPITVSVSITGASYTVSPDTATIPGNSTVELTVTYHPVSEGTFTGILSVGYGSGEEVTAAVAGSALDAVVAPVVEPIVIDLPAGAYGITAIGDSLTEGGVSFNNGWLSKACFYGNQTLRYRNTLAVSGSTVNEALTLQLPGILAMDPPPKVCVVATGTNSIYQGTGSTEKVKEICDILIANKIYPVLWTIPPRNDQTDMDANVAAWNGIIRDYHLATGIPLLDAFRALQVPGSFRARAECMDPDGLHFNNYGYTVLGRYAIDSGSFRAAPTDGTIALATAVGGTNLVPNPLFAGTGGVSDNLTLLDGFTGELLAAEHGNWQRITRGAGVDSATSVNNQIDPFPVTPGARTTLACKARWDTAGLLGGVNTVGAGWQLLMMGMFTDATWRNYPNSLHVILGPQGDSIEEGTLYAEMDAPAGANRLLLQLFAISAEVPTNALPISIDYSQLTVVSGGFAFNNIDPSPVPVTPPESTALLDGTGSTILDNNSAQLES